MAEYIRRIDLVMAMDWDEDIDRWTICEDDLDDLTLECVVPTETAEWVTVDMGNGFKRVECSKCGCEAVGYWDEQYECRNYVLTKFCPTCGTRTDKRTKEEVSGC